MLISRQDKLNAQTVCDMAKAFYQNRWLMGTSGNLSFRADLDAKQYWITESGRHKGHLKPDDFLCMGAQTTVLDGSHRKPSAEALLHETVYERFPHIQAVFHVHSVNATVLSRHLLSTENVVTLCDLEMLKGLGADTHATTLYLPVLENHQDMRVLQAELQTRLDAAVPGFLLKGHGLYAWGESLHAAQRHIEIFEFLFEVQFKELLLAQRPTPTGSAVISSYIGVQPALS